MNTLASPRPPLLLPSCDPSPRLGFHGAEGFQLPLLSFPSCNVHLVASAEHRPTVPEFLGGGWHLPLDRIVADFRRQPGRATLFQGTRAFPLRQTGWSSQGIDFQGPEIDAARFSPREGMWEIGDPHGRTSLFTVGPRGAPLTWYLSEIREQGELRCRFAHHHGRCTHLVEIRDCEGNCARFEHAPLRGHPARLLLRAISVEGPHRTALGRLQFSYCVVPLGSGHEALLHSVLLRDSRTPSGCLRGWMDYFPPRAKRPRLLKALHFSSRSALLFVPVRLHPGDGVPGAGLHPPAPQLSAMRIWHEEDLTVVAGPSDRPGRPSVHVTLHSRRPGQEPACLRRTLRHCRVDLAAATCHAAGGQVILVMPNLLKPGGREILLWRWHPGLQRWFSHRRTVQCASLEILAPGPDGHGLQIVREADPHTCYHYHWFDQPRAWSLTSMVPACAQAAPAEAWAPSMPAEPEQDALFASRPGAGAAWRHTPPGTCAEDQIHWLPGELFAGLHDGHEGQDVALTA